MVQKFSKCFIIYLDAFYKKYKCIVNISVESRISKL